MGNNNARRPRRQDTYATSGDDVTGGTAGEEDSDCMEERSSSGYHSTSYNPYGEEIDPLEGAIRDERLDDVRALMMTHRPGQQKADSTPVHVACESGALSSLRYLTDSCLCDVNGSDSDTGNTSPLIVASRFGHVDVVRYLLDKGADIDQRSKQENCHRFLFEDEAMNMTRDRGLGHLPASVQREMWDPYLGNTALIQATREQNELVVHELLKRGADVNIHNTAGNTALHVACLSRTAELHCSEFSQGVPSTLLIGGHPDVVRTLLQHGARVDKVNLSRETPVARVLRVTHMGPLCMWDWNFTEREIVALTRRTLQIVRHLVAAGCRLPAGALAAVWNIAAVQPTQAGHADFLATLAVLREAGFRAGAAELESLLREYVVYTQRFPGARAQIAYVLRAPLTLKMAAVVSVRARLRLPFCHTAALLPLPRELQADVLLHHHST